MDLPDDAPFTLGTTYKGTNQDGGLINSEWLGRIFYFKCEVKNSFTGMLSQLTGRRIGAMILRNTTGGVIYGKNVTRLAPTADSYASFHNAVAVAAADNRFAFVNDFYLPAGGVANNDLFYGLFAGPAIVRAPVNQSNFGGADIAVGDQLGTSADAIGRVKKSTTAGAQFATSLTPALAASESAKELLVYLHAPWAC